LGNQVIAINFAPQTLIGLLKDYRNRVINCSFQVGEIKLINEKLCVELPTVIQPFFVYETNEQGEPVNTEFVYINERPDHMVITSDNGQPIYDSGEPLRRLTKEQYNNIITENIREAENQAKIVEGHSIKVIGAYDRSLAEQNLPKLFEVCQSYPDKLFVVAAGNEEEDLGEALERLAGQRPDNLLIVGQWTEGLFYRGGAPTYHVQGADIYVNNSSLGAPDGSSFSTPVISAWAEMLMRKGLAMEDTVAKIRQSCTNSKYTVSGIIDENEALVFDDRSIKLLQ
jgi:hypothetical protein